MSMSGFDPQGGVWSQHSKYKIRVINRIGEGGFSIFQSGTFLEERGG